MGIFTKNNHGIEYLYALAGKFQFFLGRKDEPDNLNLNNLRKSIKIIDQNFDKTLEKYLEDVKEYSSYIPQPDRNEYLSKRTAELVGRLRRLEEESFIIKKAQQVADLIGGAAAVAASPTRDGMDREHKKRKKKNEEKK